MSDTGVLELTAAKKQLKTIISDCYYEGGFKITRPVYSDSLSPTIFLIHVGGGFVDGDTYRMNLILSEEAELTVTTQSSTKVYRTPNQPVRQVTEITLKKGSLLEFFPDPLIAYEGSRFIQETTVYKEDDSVLFYSDIITPGWARDGRFFRYDWIRSKLKVYQNNRLILFDHLFLEQDGDAMGLLKMDGYSHIGSLFLLHPNIGKDFIDRLLEFLNDGWHELRFGISLLPIKGCIVRILGRSTGEIEKMIHAAHSFARKELLNKEPVVWRKY
ncbi:urease accessory protein UreD [Neobacillus sp. LXY-4]|uniref:urease accessory protein UreD n=1 Tax=Neobacillus sp. LXY-4 TaxID=3379826 RepID=UPI003EE11224